MTYQTYHEKIHRLYARETRLVILPAGLILSGLWLVAMAYLFTI